MTQADAVGGSHPDIRVGRDMSETSPDHLCRGELPVVCSGLSGLGGSDMPVPQHSAERPPAGSPPGTTCGRVRANLRAVDGSFDVAGAVDARAAVAGVEVGTSGQVVDASATPERVLSVVAEQVVGPVATVEVVV